MTNIVSLDPYELHPGDEKSLMTLLMNAKVLHYTYDMGSILLKKYICTLILMTIYDYKSFYIYILSLVFLPFKLNVYILIVQNYLHTYLYIYI